MNQEKEVVCIIGSVIIVTIIVLVFVSHHSNSSSFKGTNTLAYRLGLNKPMMQWAGVNPRNMNTNEPVEPIYDPEYIQFYA